MSVGAETPRTNYTGNGATTVFAIGFTYTDATDVTVYLDDVLQGSGFTVGASDVTFSTAPASGVNVTLLRSTPLTQEIPFDDPQLTTLDEVERLGDKLTRAVQEQDENKNRGLQFPPSFIPVNAPNTTIGLDENGDPEARTVLQETTHLGIASLVQDAADSRDEAAADAAIANARATEAAASAAAAAASATDAAESAGIPFEWADEIWIAHRSDGLPGDGTYFNPFDGSTASKFQAIIDASANRQVINVGVGTFEVNPDYPGSPGVLLKIGQTLRGAGIDKTTIKVVSDTNPGDNYNAIEGNFNQDGITVEHLTVDVQWNHSNLYSDDHVGQAVVLRGDHCTIRNVRAINWGGDWDNSRECFPISISAGATECYQGLIENCIVESPIAGGTNTLAYYSALYINGQGVIRNNCVEDVDGNDNIGFGCVGSSGEQTLVEVTGNIFRFVRSGVNGDSSTAGSFIIHHNFFDRCYNQWVGFAFVDNGSYNDLIHIHHNIVAVPPPRGAYSGDQCYLRIGGGTTGPGRPLFVKINDNYLYSQDRTSSVARGGFRVFRTDNYEVSNNIFDPLLGEDNEILTDVTRVSMRNNRYLDGSIRSTLSSSPIVNEALTTAVLTRSDHADQSLNMVRCSNAGGCTITLNDEATAGWVEGDRIEIRRTSGAGALALTLGGGVTVDGNAIASLAAGKSCFLRYLGSDAWDYDD